MRKLIARILRRIADVFHKEKDWKAEAINKAAEDAKEVDLSSGIDGLNIEPVGIVGGSGVKPEDLAASKPKWKYKSEPPKVVPPEKRVLTEVQINKPKPESDDPKNLEEKLKDTWDSV